jgi:DNA-binding GntR family transcriptional regulator
LTRSLVTPSETASQPSRRSGVSAEAVAAAVRHAIQSNEIASGEWLRESRLCEDHGVGRSVVRKALRILADDGLVRIEENRGACVSTTTVEEVFDLYELRAGLYGVAARFACMRATDEEIATMIAAIDIMMADSAAGVSADKLIEQSERIFGTMIAMGSLDAQNMIESIRRKTRFHFSYAALALNQDSSRPFSFWMDVRAALVDRNADAASRGARNILYFMQGEVARMMLSHGPRVRHTAYSQAQQANGAEPGPRPRRSTVRKKPGGSG